MIRIGKKAVEIGKDNLREALYAGEVILLIGMMSRCLWMGDLKGGLLCFLAGILVSVPGILCRIIGLSLSVWMEFFFSLLIVFSLALGEVLNFYERYAYWDTMLHWLSGFLFAAIGIGLFQSRREEEDPLAMPAGLCFSFSVGVIWEFFEFAVDLFFGGNMQKDTLLSEFRGGISEELAIRDISQMILVGENGQSLVFPGYLDIGLWDTMGDLLSCAVGSLFCLCLVRRGRGSILYKILIPITKEDEKLS